ncbi:MAG: hypothetical protein MJ227_01130 [Bacilli bacterium]|nr:hypothetical protein [Bacilli bacterium]
MRKLAKYIPFIFLVGLTSCGTLSPLSFVKFNYDSVPTINVKRKIDNEIFYQNEKFDNQLTYYNTNNELVTESYEKYIPHKSRMSNDKEAKLLVIPVSLKNDKKTEKQKKEMRIAIENAFFGASSMSQYYSVAEYYKRSSYGALNIEGFVTDWYQYDEDITSSSGGQETSKKVLKKALADIINNEDKYFFKETEDEDTKFNDLSCFVKEGTNIFDGIFLIYDHPYDTVSKTDNVYWAFTNSIEPSISTQVGNYKFAYYSWASYDFIKLADNKSDSKTYIHETGHLLGLEDYYNREGLYQPTGGIDMMDTNLGDHSAFSKMLLNWITPKVIKKSGSITLSDLQGSGDCLLIPKYKNGELTYNNTAYDEYVLVEYFVPKNSNYHIGNKYVLVDKKGNEHVFTYPTTYGLKISHIDARLAYYVGSPTNKFLRLLEEKGGSSVPTPNLVNYARRNSDIFDSDTNNRLIHLLEKDGKNTFKLSNPGGNETIFIVGETFNSSLYNELSEFGFTISVNQVKENSINITINFNK